MAFTVNSPSTVALVAAVQQFAGELEIPCQSSELALLDCRKQPIHIFAFLTRQGAAVCFDAMGAPFERAKFEARISRLEQILLSRFGTQSVVSSLPAYPQCAPPQLPSGYRLP